MTLEGTIIKIRDLSKSVANIFQIYYNKFELAVCSGVEPFLAEELLNIIKTTLEETKLSKYATKTDFDFDTIFALYAEIFDIYQKLQRVFNIFNENKLDISRIGTSSSGSTLTKAYMRDAVETYQKVIGVFEKYESEILSYDLIHTILNQMSDKLTNINMKNVKTINDLYSKYVSENKGDLIINLYSSMLQQIIYKSTGTTDGKEIIKYVNKHLEYLKSEILSVDLNRKNITNNSNAIQDLIQVHNLIPVNISMPINKLMEIIDPKIIEIKFDTDINKYLGNVSKYLSVNNTYNKKMGFILIKKIIKNSVEYNLLTLIDKKYIDDNHLNQLSDVGLNNIVLERCNTIKINSVNILEKNTSKQKSNKQELKDYIIIFSDEFQKETDNNFYIIETLDDINYRFLSPYKTLNMIPEEWFKNIKNKEISPSKRLESYNTIINDEIFKYLKKPMISYNNYALTEIQKEDTHWKVLRNKIKKQIVEDFENLFVNKFELEKKIEINAFSKILLKKELYENALIHITNSIELDIGSKSDFNIRNQILFDEIINQIQIELTISYFRDLIYIQKNLKRDVDTIYKSDYYDKIVNILKSFDGTQGKFLYVKNKIIEIYGLILDDVLERFINKKSNIYISIQRKYNILKKTLIS